MSLQYPHECPSPGTGKSASHLRDVCESLARKLKNLRVTCVQLESTRGRLHRLTPCCSFFCFFFLGKLVASHIKVMFCRVPVDRHNAEMIGLGRKKLNSSLLLPLHQMLPLHHSRCLLTQPITWLLLLGAFHLQNKKGKEILN